MIKKVRVAETTLPRLRDVGVALPRVDAAVVQAALGAEATPTWLDHALAPLTLFALREELYRRLASSGGRPALAGTTRRAKIPLSDTEWLQLEDLAAAVAAPGFAPSAGQMASVLLTKALGQVASQLDAAGKVPNSF